MALFSKLGGLAALGIALLIISSTIVALFQVGDLAAMPCGLPVLGVLCSTAILLYTKIKISWRESVGIPLETLAMAYFLSSITDRASMAVLAQWHPRSSSSILSVILAFLSCRNEDLLLPITCLVPNWMIDPLFTVIQHVSIERELPCPFIITGKTILVHIAEGAQCDLIDILGEQRPAMVLKRDDRYPITRGSTPSHVDLFLYVASDELLHNYDALTQQTRAAYLAAKVSKPVDAFVVVGKKKEMMRDLGLGPACLLLSRGVKRQLDKLGYEYRLYCFKDRSPLGFIDAPAPGPYIPPHRNPRRNHRR
ncbi:hypothetical protein SELMODRAFT_404459 [Selaginella moellendorffii]|uniref:Uncharacterized protein n=2 Tax=Selaginella moellendorffii TaxID=88036 RepID=D8QVE2_SELML|nr:hypothetical protein SELMODRAFT_404459 [Selaginella moellendorffii]